MAIIWKECTEFYVASPTGKNSLLFVRHDGAGSIPPGGHVPDVWHPIDVTPLGVALDGKGIFASGVMNITHDGSSNLGETWIKFREHEHTGNSGYNSQAIVVKAAQGARTNMSEIIPIKDGKFDFMWHFDPDMPNGLINLSLQAWMR